MKIRDLKEKVDSFDFLHLEEVGYNGNDLVIINDGDYSDMCKAEELAHTAEEEMGISIDTTYAENIEHCDHCGRYFWKCDYGMGDVITDYIRCDSYCLDCLYESKDLQEEYIEKLLNYPDDYDEILGRNILLDHGFIEGDRDSILFDDMNKRKEYIDKFNIARFDVIFSYADGYFTIFIREK